MDALLVPTFTPGRSRWPPVPADEATAKAKVAPTLSMNKEPRGWERDETD